jgi:hypothetical protein
VQRQNPIEERHELFVNVSDLYYNELVKEQGRNRTILQRASLGEVREMVKLNEKRGSLNEFE